MQDLATSTGSGLDALEQGVRTALEMLKYPEHPWVPARQVDGKALLHVALPSWCAAKHQGWLRIQWA